MTLPNDNPNPSPPAAPQAEPPAQPPAPPPPAAGQDDDYDPAARLQAAFDAIQAKEDPDEDAEPPAAAEPPASEPPADPPAQDPDDDEAADQRNTPMGKALQRLQQDVAQVKDLRQDITAIKETLDALKATPSPAATPATQQQQKTEQQQLDDIDAQLKEIEAMASDDYQSDVLQDPKKIAKGMTSLVKQIKELRESIQRTSSEAAQQAIQQTEQQREARQALQQITEQLPDLDLKSVYGDAKAQAEAEGFGEFGEAAVNKRAKMIFAQKVDSLLEQKKTSPAARAAAAAPPVKQTAAKAPPRPATPGATRTSTPAGTPTVTDSADEPLSLDAIFRKHSGRLSAARQ